MSSGQHKYWVFTWNNPNANHGEVVDLFEAHPAFQFLAFQYEQGENGTRHYQGYVEFNRKVRLAGLKKFKKELHWEPRAGTQQQALDYVRKADTRLDGPWEAGTLTTNDQGARNDLVAAIALMSQKGLQAVADEMPLQYAKYSKNLQALRFRQHPKTRDPPEVHLIYGPTGCGKTRTYRQLQIDHPEFTYWEQAEDAKLYMDGYDGEEVVLIDEFDGKRSQMGLKVLLQMLDRYVVKMPARYAPVWWYPKKIYITTNFHPREWYDWMERRIQYAALARRITHVHQFDMNWQVGDAYVDAEVITPGTPQWTLWWEL